MGISSQTAKHRGRLGASVRFGNVAEAERCRGELAVAVAEDRIADLLAKYNITPEQRQRLVALLAAEGHDSAPQMGPSTHAPEHDKGRDLPSPGLATAPR